MPSTDLCEQTKGKEYRIDPEFQSLFPAKTETEYQELKELIRKDGVTDSMKVWEETGDLLDGYTRDKIIDELAGEGVPIKPQICKMSFSDREAAKMWIVRNQIARRNLSIFPRVEAALHFAGIFASKGKANQSPTSRALSQDCAKVDTNEEIGKLSNTSRETVRRVKIILEKASPEEIDLLRKDELSINSVFQKYDGKEQSSKPAPKVKKNSGNGPTPKAGEGNKLVEEASEQVDDSTTENIEIDSEPMQNDCLVPDDAVADNEIDGHIADFEEGMESEKSMGEIMDDALDSLEIFLKSLSHEDRVKELDTIDGWIDVLQGYYDAICKEI